MHTSNWNKKPLQVLETKVILSTIHKINLAQVLNEER